MSLTQMVSQIYTTLKLEQFAFGIIFLVSLTALSLYFGDRARKGKVPYVRRLEALDGIDQAIDKAVEIGKPVYYEVSGALRGEGSHMVAAALSILPYVARRCAEKGTRLVVGYLVAELQPLLLGQLETAAKAVGKDVGYFKREDLIFNGTDAFSAAANSMHNVEVNDARASIVMGSVGINALPLAEANRSRGCISIQGTAYMSQIHAIGLCSDYNLIGEELYAAGAMLSKDVDRLAFLRSQDVGKLVMILLVPILYAVLYVANIKL